ncbi:Maf1 regulator-domain-containing protein [Xylaria sp. CBS 124048]|nr:Maf1 regulator-domain-containing protein [Xylaria sp. CBS 124048]
MKFLSLRDFDVITSALNFSTVDCKVTGGCDLYTTKAAGSDKKLYKSIECSLESQHAALLKFGASLSPPQRKEMAASLNLSRSSPFGPLSEISCRRTYAYLIATLNASHPDYDFSHALSPTDFRREKSLRHVMASVDGTLNSIRPQGASLLSPNMATIYSEYANPPSATVAGDTFPVNSPAWGPHMWNMIDKEMTLNECTVFSYQPPEDPFDGDEAAIWRLHYFFFNKKMRRVAYLYVRGLPVVVNSPTMVPHKRGLSGLAKRHATPLAGSLGANKRAKFWLGDHLADRVIADEDGYDDADDEPGLIWNPDDDVTLDPLNDPSTEEESSDEYSEEPESGSEGEEDVTLHSVRGVSEEIAAHMEL